MSIRLAVNRYWLWDFRSLAMRRQDDKAIERRWRERVARNPKEVARLRRLRQAEAQRAGNRT